MLLSKPTRVAWDEGELILDARLILNPDLTLQRWNGWVCPAFDRTNAQKIIDYNDKAAKQYGDHSFDTFSWDGDELVIARDGEFDRLEGVVDELGETRWSIGAWGWTWSEVVDVDLATAYIGSHSAGISALEARAIDGDR